MVCVFLYHPARWLAGTPPKNRRGTSPISLWCIVIDPYLITLSIHHLQAADCHAEFVVCTIS